MLKQLTLLAAAVTVAIPALVCAQQPAAPAAPSPGDVAARVGDRVITVAELDEAWRQENAAAQAQAAQAMYDGRKQALDRLVADMLIERAAQAKGLPAEQFSKEEIARRTKPITDADVAAFYEQNASRMQGKPLQDMRGAIRSFLQQQRYADARQALIGELRAAGPAVRVALDPPRQKVDVAATDPARGAGNAPVVLVEYSDYQ
ncbi:MAG: SurA N-terminal domain-containing protein [Vicinamibacterales bacterium]